MKEESKHVLYVVIEQGVTCHIDYEELFRESKVIYVYCRDVYVDIHTFDQPKQCQLFSLEPLPEQISCKELYTKKATEQARMMMEVLADPNCKIIIWTFPLQTRHFGAYVQFMYELEKREKKLMFLISPEQMEELRKNELFHQFSSKFVEKGVIQIKELVHAVN